MALTWNYGTGAQATPAKTLSYFSWKYNDAYRVTENAPNRAKFTDILAPVDKPTEIKISIEPINNVYSTLANAKVPVSSQNANTTGTSIFVQLRTVANYTRTIGTTSQDIQLPLEGRIQLRLANDAEITNAEVDLMIGAMLACLRNEDGTSRVGEIMRGSLVPKEI
jgi:hypothetical protein